MANLSDDARRKLIHAVADKVLGAQITDKLNLADAGASQDLFPIPLLIVATSTSTTVDFGSLAVGDKIVVILPAAGSAHFVSCATAGTLPEAAVIGQLYIVFRSFSVPAASASTL